MSPLRRLLRWLAELFSPAPTRSPEAGDGPSSAATAAEPVGKKAKADALDAGDFLPISRDEVKAVAGATNLFANPWFGRRDLIPPADDPRTRLIDRSMVTHGLLSPEQLAEIHA